MQTLRRCTKCKQEKPISDFPTNGLTSRGTQRLHSWCRECLCSHSHEWQIAHPDYFTKWTKANHDKVLAASRRYNKNHADRRKQGKVRYRAGAGKVVEQRYGKKYRLIHREAIRSYMRSYLTQYYQQHRDDLIAYQLRYHTTPIGKAVERATHMKRRAVTAGLAAENLAPLITQIRLAPSVICHLCGKPLSGERCQIDHIIPLAKGGGHTRRNIAPAHQVCNQRKGAKVVPSVAPFDPDTFQRTCVCK